MYRFTILIPCCFVFCLKHFSFDFYSKAFQVRNTIISNEKLIKSSTLQHFLLKYFGNINVLLLWQFFGIMLYCESLLVKLKWIWVSRSIILPLFDRFFVLAVLLYCFC